jgi:hypothetical protein
MNKDLNSIELDMEIPYDKDLEDVYRKVNIELPMPPPVKFQRKIKKEN